MAQTAGPGDQLDDELGALASDTTELGIVVGDMFQYAAASLFGREPEAARFAMDTRAWVTQSVSVLRRRVRLLIQRFAPDGSDLRRIAELQQAATEYARISELAGQVAENALRLDGGADTLLLDIHPEAPDLVRELISVVVEQMRGVFLVTASRDARLAQELFDRDADVDDVYKRVYALLDWQVHRDPFNALPIHRLVIVVSDVRRIGSSIKAICHSSLGS